jgi:hypothetical protein
MILAGVPIIVAVAFSLTPHDAQSSDAIAAEAIGHHVTVSDAVGVAILAGDDDQSTGATSLVALPADPDWERGHDKTKEPTYKPTRPTETKTVKPTETKTTAPPTTKPPVTTPATVEPTRTELPVTGGREVSLAVAGAGMVLIGALLFLLRRMARDG